MICNICNYILMDIKSIQDFENMEDDLNERRLQQKMKAMEAVLDGIKLNAVQHLSQ